MLESRTLAPLRTGRSAVVLALALVLSLLAMLLPSVSSPAGAAERPEGALSLTKSVDEQQSATLVPGDEFVYTLVIGCDDYDCADVVLTDAVPAELAGFELESTAVSPSRLPASVDWGACADGSPLTADCVLTVTPQQDLGDGDLGITAGTEYRIDITLKVPDDLAPDWEFNGADIVNSASATASNASPVEDDAALVVDVPVAVDVDASKDWQPASQGFAPGAASTITVGAANASNIPVDSITIQEPSDAPDGATALADDNPFRLVDLSGIGETTLPEGADAVRVDVYVFDEGSGTWSWQQGTPGATAALPEGVDPSTVGGVRISYTGDSIVPGAAGSLPIAVEQRAEDRITGDSLVGGAELTNTVSGTVAADGQDPVTDEASAPYAITPLDVATGVTKSFDPADIPAGGSSTATIEATNASTVPVDRLTVSDTDFFTEQWRFAGFDSAPTFPAGATGTATIVWHLADGSTVEQSFAEGETPVAPAGVVSGFDITFTGSIEAGASATVTPTVDVAVDVVSADDRTVTRTNTADAEVENAAGTATDTADAPLDVRYPEIDIDLDKTIRPGGAVQPGGSVVSELETTIATGSGLVDPTQIVVEDSWGEDRGNSFWNAFTPTAIAPTQIPAGTSMTVTYTLADGSTVEGPVADARDGAWVFSADIDPALAEQIVGISYTFTNEDGFPKGTTVAPNTEFEARDTLRDGSGDTSVPNGGPSSYENYATARGSGDVPGLGPIDSDVVDDSASAQIESFACDGGGECSIGSSKRWVQPSDGTTDLDYLSSLSGADAKTRLGWTVLGGLDRVVISDPAGEEASPADTVFQAFDLTAVDPIGFDDDPYLRWDAVASVELYDGASGAWTTVPAPSGGWMDDAGFVGYELTAAESASTTGVRLSVVPDDEARAASDDPDAPAVGSGVAASTANPMRPVLLSWQLRSDVRVEQDGRSPWAIAERLFNDSEAGTVWNTVRVTGEVDGEPVGSHTSRDNIALIDLPPAVALDKSVEPGVLTVPNNEDVAAEDYPGASYTLRSWNDGAGQDPNGETLPSSNAAQMRVTDPAPCGDDLSACVSSSPAQLDGDVFASAVYDPATNPFEWQDVTGLSFDVDEE